MRALLTTLALLAPASTFAQVVPTPLQGPAAFDRGLQVRALAALDGPGEQVGLGVAYGSEYLRVAAALALDGGGGDERVRWVRRIPEQSKERFEPSAADGRATLHASLFLGLAPTLFEVELDDVRKLAFEALGGVGADLFFDFDEGRFPLRFAPELGLGIRAQIFEILFARVVVSAERDLTEFVSDLSDATFVLRGALEVGADLPEPQPAIDGAPDTTRLRASFALERPLEDSVTRPGAYFVTVGVAY